MALVDQVTLASDNIFQGRVRQSMIATAIAIANEGWAVALHERRAKLVTLIMNNPGSYAPLFTNAVATDATVQASAGVPAVQANVTDANINNAVSSVFNSFFTPFSG